MAVEVCKRCGGSGSTGTLPSGKPAQCNGCGGMGCLPLPPLPKKGR